MLGCNLFTYRSNMVTFRSDLVIQWVVVTQKTARALVCTSHNRAPDFVCVGWHLFAARRIGNSDWLVALGIADIHPLDDEQASAPTFAPWSSVDTVSPKGAELNLNSNL